MLRPWDFQALRFTSVAEGDGLLAVCAFCEDQVLVPLREARPSIRLALGLVTPPAVLRSIAGRVASELDETGGTGPFLEKLARDGVALGEIGLKARSGLLIALDEGAEVEALETEWARAEEMAAIADGELSKVPGFDDFRREILGA